MSFSYDPATDAGRVRRGLGDTHPSSGVFTDAEIAQLLTDGGSVDGAINEGLRVLMSAAAHKGDVARVAALREVLTLRGGEIPTVTPGWGGAVPTDDGYEPPTI